MDPSDSNSAPLPASSSSTTQKPPGNDVKPRLTKDQHDVLEHHFQQQHKPSTNVKKEFAVKLGVPLDKINNWFQNRRAKVKQDRKKMMNHFTMNMNMSFPQPRGPVMAGHYEPQLEQQQQLLQLQPQPQPQPHQHQPQQQQSQQAQMYPHQDFYPMNTDMSTAMHPAQNGQGPSALELTSQISLQQQQQYDMQHALRSIPEANQSAAYHPNAVMHSIMAATNGAYLQNTGMPMDPQNHGFPYDTTGISQSYPADLDFSVPAQASHDFAPSHPEFTNFADFSVDYSSITGADANPSHSADLQHSTGSQSSDASPFSGAQSIVTTQSPNDPPPPSVASVTSLYSGWTDQPQMGQAKPCEEESEDPFTTSYTASDQALSFWNEATPPVFTQPNFYQHSNTSAHAIMTSPDQSHSRQISATPADFDLSVPFNNDAYTRRSSSTSNLANNMDAVHIRNGTPDDLMQSNQSSSIAARRQKRPVALNSNAMRSASFSASMPSPGGSNDQTLRRIRSGGFGNHGGRVHKSQPSSAQRSPLAASFSEAAASPKFARTFSSSTTVTVANSGSLAPPTPLTPQDFGNYWQGSTVIRPHSVMPEHNSPESLHTNWSSDQAGNVIAKTTSPPAPSLDLQSRFANDALYRDTPPQSAPATQQNFPRSVYTQQLQTRTGFHSTTDLTIQQPKPSHFRRPSLPDDAQPEAEDLSAQCFQGSNLNYDDYKDISLNSIHHGIPFAPPVSSVPDFLVHEYAPPQGNDPNGHMLRRATEPQNKSYIFANQGPGDFRIQ
ncbi:hypothetical protein LEMA_P054670.1 [Plenodomus lingam JN3]|uniref:Homeobox domain-containing protein n=1 Tax=Leptosphaeria maculans (strain JN3 / isolate v23.1.3 / race Av1-4-5-6-7-8) TaxID=985895 RepID=E4ZLT1_LEPMJ|nr:hypothetical protein LEMA_P054670.1 [Plenodomus lingam JN3]CBX92761.1 hypothetical protein LEMA_P054670.1 [Plenodomus lingam JN3]